jgi:hypothetical protein
MKKITTLLITLTLLQSCEDDSCKGVLQSVPFNQEATPLVERYLEEHIGETGFGGKSFCACSIYGFDSSRIYLWYRCHEYHGTADSMLEGTATSGPLALTYNRDSTLHMLSHARPRDGAQHAADIEQIFPPCVIKQLDKENARPDTMHARTREKALKWIKYPPLPDTVLRQ